jgi:hypothetical protein
MAEFVEKTAQMAVENAVIHGMLIGVLGLLVAGFSCLASRLGENSFLARSGLVAYGAGAIAMAAAGLVSGFLVPEFVSRYHDRPHEELETVRHILGLCRSTNQVCSRVGVLGAAIAILLWSLLLCRDSGFSFTVGALGVVIGATLTLGLLFGYLPMNIHGMLAFLLAQTVWNLGVAVLLFRNRI